ncbi:MAG: hypothetical protein Q9201_001701 [Fulgogasparrea decipioides]
MLIYCLPLAFLLLTRPSSAVDITLSRRPRDGSAQPSTTNRNNVRPFGGGNTIDMMTYQRCLNQPPGVCCKPRPPPPGLLAGGFQPMGFDRVTFTGLEPLHIAAAWVPRGQVLGCYGIPKETHWGGGDWVYDLPDGDADSKLSGANYIKMPTALPPSPTDSKWLSAEGLKGFVWGRGSWMADNVPSAARAALLAAAEAQLRSGPGFKKRTPNPKIRSADKGVVFCQAPESAVWANVIAIDGTEFTAEGSGSPVYTSADGKLLNYTGAAT